MKSISTCSFGVFAVTSFLCVLLIIPYPASALELFRNGVAYDIPLLMPDGMQVDGNEIDKTLTLGDIRGAIRLIQDPETDCRPMVEARYKSRLKDGFSFRPDAFGLTSDKTCRLLVRNLQTGQDIRSLYKYLEPCACFIALHFYYPSSAQVQLALVGMPIYRSLDYYSNGSEYSEEPIPEIEPFPDSKITIHPDVYNLKTLRDNIGPLECNITFRGTIEAGDADRLREAYTLLSESQRYQRYHAFLGWGKTVLCLDSPGGSFLEALNFVRAELQLTTLVQDGDSCLSACSIIFMAGLEGNPGIGNSVSRFLEPGGVLGFHTPSLEVPDDNYRAAQVSKAYGIAIQSIYEIIAELMVPAPGGLSMELQDPQRFPPSLLMYMLKTPPDAMFEIDTIGKAARWHIELSHRGPLKMDRKRLSERHFEFACDNVIAWRFNEEQAFDKDQGEPGYENMLSTGGRNPAAVDGDGLVKIGGPGIWGHECWFSKVAGEEAIPQAPQMNISDWVVKAQYGGVRDDTETSPRLPLETFLDPETPLVALR